MATAVASAPVVNLRTVSSTPARKAATPRKRPVPLAQRQARAEKAARWVAIIGTGAVWINALWISYFHICELLVSYGQSQATAHQYPFIVDGLMMVASVAIVTKRAGRLAYAVFSIGALATIAANVASVHNGSVGGYVTAGFTGVSLIGSAYLLERLVMPHTRKRTTRKPATPRKSK